MKFQFTVQQLNVMQQTLDIALRDVGLSGLWSIVELVKVLETPLEKADEQQAFFEYEMTENQAALFVTIFDIALKKIGLSGGANIVAVAQVFQAAVQKDEENKNEGEQEKAPE